MRFLRQCIRVFTPLRNPRKLTGQKSVPRCTFHISAPLAKIKPFLLPDIGEGIKEVQIIQWFVEPEARVEQFDKLCEVQSDKAAAEITSRYDGVIKKIYYEAEDMAQVGKPLCDIDVQDDLVDEETHITPSIEPASSASSPQQPQQAMEQEQEILRSNHNLFKASILPKFKHISLATPAVRGLLKELEANIEDIVGTGKDGRVMKDDVHKYAAARDANQATTPQISTFRTSVHDDRPQIEKRITMTPIQSQMFKTMTRSLTIPHFLFADEINLTPLSALRHRLNIHPESPQRLSSLAFLIKAVSLALEAFPLLNSRIDLGSPAGCDPPQLITREKHNVGVAMDTPQGLLVPNIKNVTALSILDIAADLARLQRLAKSGKLSVADLSGGTITVSNIGSIGGTYVAPLIVPSEVAILGVGKARTAPAFDEEGRVVKREVVNFSWSADHRVVDGATMARMAERVRGFVEEPATMLARLR